MNGFQHKPANGCWKCVRRLPDGAALSLVPLRKSGVALRLPPHSRAAHSHANPYRTTGLKGRNIIAQGKGADRRPSPWVANHPHALGAAAFLPPVEQTESVAVDRDAFVSEFGSRIGGPRRMTCPTCNAVAWPVNKEPFPYSPFSPPKIASKTPKTGVWSSQVVAALKKPVVRPR